MEEIKFKVCSICGRELPEECFHSNKANRDGKDTRCIECEAESRRIRREHPELPLDERKELVRSIVNARYLETHAEALADYNEEEELVEAKVGEFEQNHDVQDQPVLFPEEKPEAVEVSKGEVVFAYALLIAVLLLFILFYIWAS